MAVRNGDCRLPNWVYLWELHTSQEQCGMGWSKYLLESCYCRKGIIYLKDE